MDQKNSLPQLLDGPNIIPVLQQVGHKGVTKNMAAVGSAGYKGIICPVSCHVESRSRGELEERAVEDDRLVEMVGIEGQRGLAREGHDSQNKVDPCRFVP